MTPAGATAPATASPTATRSSAAHRWGVIGLLSIAFVIAYFDRVNLSVVLAVPEFKSLFKLTDSDRGLLNAAFFWSYALLQIPAGWLVDRFGARRSLAVGYALWSVFSGLTAFVGSFWQLFAVRLLLGFGEAVNTPAGMRWIRYHCGETERGLAVGVYMAAAKVGPALGVPLATWLVAEYGWRPMFAILGFGALLWVVPWLLVVRDDDRGAPPAESRATAPAAAAAPAVASAAPMPFSKIARSPALWGVLTGTFCYQCFLYFCMTWMPAYFVERRNLSLNSMGLYTMFSFMGMAVVATVAGWATDRLIARGGDPVIVRRRFAIAGLLMASTEIIGAFSSSSSVALFFAIFSLSGLGLATASHWALTQSLIPGVAVGRIVGIQNFAANIPGIVAPMMTGWLKQTTGSYEAPMAAIGVILLIGVGSYVFLVRREYAPRPA